MARARRGWVGGRVEPVVSHISKKHDPYRRKDPTMLNRTALPLLAALALVVGCNQGPTDQIPEQTRQVEQQMDNPTPDAPQKDAMRGHGSGKRGFRGPAAGPAMLLGAALNELELRADQKSTIEGLLADLKQDKAGSTHRDLDRALASEVRSGKLDDAAFASQLASIEKEATERATKTHTALNSLHETLDTEQRSALVAALKQKVEAGPRAERRGTSEPGVRAKRGGHSGMRGDRRAMHGAANGMHDGLPNMHGGFARGVGGIERQLDLSAEQRDQLRAARDKAPKPDFEKSMGEMKNKVGAMLDAFAKDDFDAATVMGSQDVAGRAKQATQMRVEHVRSVLAVLTPEQRVKYAELLEAEPRGRRGGPQRH